MTIGISNDLLPDISFVSFIVEATIDVVVISKFSFNGIVVFDVDWPNDVSVPSGLVAFVVLIVAVNVVPGTSIVPIIVLTVSYL